MLSREMIEELLVVEEVHFAEVTPGMRQDFSLFFIARISKLNMGFKLFHMIDALLSDKDQSTFQTDLAERLLVALFKMSLQRINALVLIARIALGNQTLKRP
jgi:hypothetical protein